MVSMNRLPAAKRTAVVRCLVEGNSIRATVRITGVAKNTVVKLLVDLGDACSGYQDRTLRDLPCRHLQADEIWAFCRAKDRNVPEEHRGELGWGDIWTWTTIDRDTNEYRPDESPGRWCDRAGYTAISSERGPSVASRRQP